MARPRGVVRLVVEVVARGASGRNGVTLRVEPARRRAVKRPRAHVKRSPAQVKRSPRKRPPARGRPATRPAVAARPSLAARSGAAVAGLAGPGWELWRFDPPVGLTRWYPAGRWRVVATARNAGGARSTASSTFLFRKATMFSGVRVTPVRGRAWRVRVSGTLMRVDPTGRYDYWSFPGQRVTVQFRKHGGRKWRSVAKARTDGEGRFARQVRRAHGTWRVIYPGNSHYSRSATSRRHVARK
ncbi:hypothetical protein Ssi03_55010 [Sphaerisporangium siamense]|nr:hypothetical protein Ssi03_55010 [Sphaerisporangium siamense]